MAPKAKKQAAGKQSKKGMDEPVADDTLPADSQAIEAAAAEEADAEGDEHLEDSQFMMSPALSRKWSLT